MHKTIWLLAATLLASPLAAQSTAQSTAAPAAAPTAAPAAAPFDVAAAKTRIDRILDRNYAQLDALYRDLHQHPELGFHEVRTAAILAKEMRKLGFTVTEHVGKTGVVAIYKNGAGPTVLVRTELDGLPVAEKTGLPYASKATQTIDGETFPTMHACGHDSHMAWWLGTAQALVAMKDQWHGTLMFIGQPAEEKIAGAQAMVDDGLFTRWPKPDYGFAAHVGPMPVGVVGIKDGTVSSASDTIKIRFNGVGAHGSMPDASIDPIVMASHFVTDVQTVVSREKDPKAFGVVTVGSFNAGFAPNIIPDHADLQLTLRSFDPATRKLQIDGVKRTANAVAAMARAPAPTITQPEGTGAVINDSKLVARVTGVLKTAIGQDAQFAPASAPAMNGSEDYSVFIDAGVPSVFYGIGGYDAAKIAQYKQEGKALPVNHSPLFAPDPEPTIRRGVETLTLSVLSVTSPGS